jgi:glycogen debranching enzyme
LPEQRVKPMLAEPGEQAPEVPFYIAATAPATRPRRTLKHDDCFAIFDSHGDIGATAGAADGLYYKDTRYLSHLELLLNGMQLLLLGSSIRDDNALLSANLTNPDIYFEKKLALPKDVLHFVRTLFLWKATAYQRIRIHNFGLQPVDCTISISFASDFADLFEIRGLRRARRGSMRIAVEGNHRVTMAYEGLDKRPRWMRIAFDPPPQLLAASAASYDLTIAPGETRWIYVTMECSDENGTSRVIPFRQGLLRAFRQRRAKARTIAAVSTNNSILNEVLCRSIADLQMLVTETDEGAYPYAGIPWYSTTFGRDGLVTAIQMLWCYPDLAKGVLTRLAALQATTSDPRADAEPGKIVHEVRNGEMAELREVPFRLYYGSVDSTPLFVLLAGLYAQRTNDATLLRTLWPNIEAALGWIDGPGDIDGDGFVEYPRRSEQGLANQGWKDSQDAIFHEDGSLAHGPVALCEVQAYVYAAKRAAADCARQLGKLDAAEALDHSATTLATKFDDAFWCPDLGTYVVALDGDKRQCRVRTSNAGQVLFGGIASKERADDVVRDLMQKSFFSGWGIRTVATDASRYNPMSYHNGSIWPHDNSLIAAGFARYGHKAGVARIFESLFEAATYLDLRRLPELFCGFPRGRGQGPTLYPVACSPQAWAAGAPFLMLQAMLGLEFNQDGHGIVLRNPQLPAFLDTVTLTNLQINNMSRVDLSVHRDASGISLEVLRNDDDVKVAQLAPESCAVP